MGKINRNKKFVSTLLVGASASSLSASTTTTNANNGLLNFFTEKVGKGIKQVLAQGIKDFVKELKKPFTFYKWVTFDMVPEAFTRSTPDLHPLQPFVEMGALFLWLVVQGVVVSIAGITVCSIYKSIKKQKFKNKVNQLEKKYGNDYIFKINGLLSEEDGRFIENIKGKYGEDYSKELEKEYRKKVLESMLENKDRSKELENCKTYFESIFVVNNPESEKYFTENKDKPENDYGLIGPNRFSRYDLKFIDKELPKMKHEIDFLKKLRNFKNDKDVIKDVRKFIAECYHFYNKNKKYTFFDGRIWFLCLYMNGVKNIGDIGKNYEEIDNKVTQFACIGNDFSLEKNWYDKEKNCGLLNDDFGAILRSYKMYKKIEVTQSDRTGMGLINLVKDEEYRKYIEILSTNKNLDEKVRDAFRKYVFYLHECNKEIKKAEKGFDDFLKDEKVTV